MLIINNPQRPGHKKKRKCLFNNLRIYELGYSDSNQE